MTRDEIEKRVKEIIAQIRGIDGLEIGLNWRLRQGTLSLNDIDMVELGMKIDETLYITTKDEDVFDCKTVGDLVGLVNKRYDVALDARIAEQERIIEAAEAEADRLRQLRAKRKAVAMLDEADRKARTK